MDWGWRPWDIGSNRTGQSWIAGASAEPGVFAGAGARHSAPVGTSTNAERALSTLWLHIGRFQILQLPTEKREALAVAVDNVRQHDFPGEFEPLRRWWRDDAPLEWDPKYD